MTTCLTNALACALDRLESTLKKQAPFLSSAMHAWMCRISPTGDPVGHFEHPRMFPLLQLPEWIVESLGAPRDPEFHDAATYSSVCGYYYTRLIDNFTDGDVGVQEDRSLISLAGVLASEFQFAYQSYFLPEHEFWKHFRDKWLVAAESAAHDAALLDISADHFALISSRKFTAAGIPVAATCFFYGKPLLVASWVHFTDSLGRWSQMFDDVLDWHEDRVHGRATWFLCEAERRKSRTESVEEWIMREGCAWAFMLLRDWMDDLVTQASCLGSESAQEFLFERNLLSAEKERNLLVGYGELARLAGILLWADRVDDRTKMVEPRRPKPERNKDEIRRSRPQSTKRTRILQPTEGQPGESAEECRRHTDSGIGSGPQRH